MAYSEQVLHRARARLEQAKAEREQENAATERTPMPAIPVWPRSITSCAAPWPS